MATSARVVSNNTSYKPQAQPRQHSAMYSRSQNNVNVNPHDYRSSDSAYDSNGPAYRNQAYTSNIQDYPSPGSMSSYNSGQVLTVQRYPLRDPEQHRTESIITPSIADSEASSYHETDVDSVDTPSTYGGSTFGGSSVGGTSGTDDPRYRDELFKPTNRPIPAPRSVEPRMTRTLFGEVHPRLLRPEDRPVSGLSTDEEVDDSSSLASLSSQPPRPHPRASLRMKRSHTITIIEQEQIDAENRLLRSCLKKFNTEPSLVSGRSGSMSKIVRFEERKTQSTNVRDITDYSDVDQGKKKKSADIWSHVQPVGPKRDDKKRSSGRQSRSSSGNRSRSSRDRSNSRNRQGQGSGRRSRSDSRSSRNGSVTGGSGRSTSKERSGSMSRSTDQRIGRDRAGSQRGEKDPKKNGERRPDDVRIQMPKERQRQGDSGQRDTQKLIKWGLIIGIPVALLIIVGIIVGVVFGAGN